MTVSKAIVAALAPMLRDSPKDALLHRDELAGKRGRFLAVRMNFYRRLPIPPLCLASSSGRNHRTSAVSKSSGNTTGGSQAMD
ncbi:MAG: hypothetical protein CBE00_04790 [Planctomycetaceae bacterium TMED240]|nr:hypothetical protein [Rhodopirellula sp.]OUX07538.1 MAG: hypothetical protein CBE00_04790 [Planctomycetaceae bacterium TMED240]